MDYVERRKVQAQNTEAAILNAALTLMREDGFEAVTVRDICQKAGITTGAFYHHFRSKEDLFRKGFAPLDQYMKTALMDYDDAQPKDRLEVILRSYAAFMEKYGTIVAQYYQRRLADPNVASIDATRYILRLMVDCFERAKQQGAAILNGDPVWAAEFCYCHFRGVVIDWLLHRREYSLTDRMMEDFSLFTPLFEV